MLVSVGGVFDQLATAASTARTPTERVRAFTRAENSACAARLSAMADMLAAAQSADGSADREQWRCDNWAAVCAAIGAAHGVTSGVATGLLTDAVVLRERLSTLAALFASGELSYRVVHLICSRTMLVRDPDAITALDTALAEVFGAGSVMSMDAVQTTVDALVLTLDPFAVRRTQAKARAHRVDVYVDDASGTAQVDACLSVTDAEAFDQRADALARTVCHRDPRDLDARRSAAMGAMAFGWDRLPCLCQSANCEAEFTPASGGVIVHVIAPQNALDGGASDPAGGPRDDGGPGDGLANPGPDARQGTQPDHRDRPRDQNDETDAATEADEPVTENDDVDGTENDCAAVESNLRCDAAGPPVGDLTAQRRGLVGGTLNPLPKPLSAYSWSGLLAAINADPGQLCPASPGVILGGAVVPAPVIAQAAMHATIRPLIHPGQAPPEPRYRPSTALAEFVRARDLTCRFPGCTRPATITDIDHTIPYPCGPTQASNLKCLCRPHHLLKTFWPGWSDRQLPNGDVIWTDPDGHTYLTNPGCKTLFPELCEPTATVTARGPAPPKHTTGLTMPRRATIRQHDRAQRIDTERRANTPDVIKRLQECVASF